MLGYGIPEFVDLGGAVVNTALHAVQFGGGVGGIAADLVHPELRGEGYEL